eukprot:CAMPEP_0183447606 /NCGR_PEP_ID=MMETSP0370-20130417/103186_1 /TAXON_ID=268820 /ORGANISM="Peridinium aciculiferum, Strain PAER-2" /LENGTH=142 /DNA_ID=CAMNT_0025638477 /DNA_START=63 /DNA_END=487 /DNA_ORIENTATION=+
MTQLMKVMDHPNIIRLYDVFEDQLDYQFVTELCTGGELLETVLKDTYFSERQAVKLMRQIFAAVGYLHSLNFCHRDIRPEHLLLETDVPAIRAQLKLIDFRCAKRFDERTAFKTVVAPPVYMAPEVASGADYNESVDLWSCG